MVLIVDNVIHNRELIKQNLEPFEINIKEADNGKIAVELCQLHSIDLVLMDIKMPIMNGYQATKLIKKHNPNIPVIAVTASTTAEDMKKIKEFKFDYNMRKPIFKHDLFTGLMKFLPYSTMDKPLKENDSISSSLSFVNDPELKKKILPLFETAKNSNNIDDIKKLALVIQKITKDSKNKPLETYAQNLLLAVDNFDIEKMKNLLGKLPF